MNAARAQQRLELSTGTAVFDEDDSRYRYLLTRTWSGARPATFIGLNPSTATATENDPTIRREIGFARAWGCGGLLKVNAFGWRSTDPDALLVVPEPVGRDNDRHILGAALAGSIVICAWGTHKAVDKFDRQRKILALLRGAGVEPMCLRQSNGRPHHPLYLPAALKPEPFKELTT